MVLLGSILWISRDHLYLGQKKKYIKNKKTIIINYKIINFMKGNEHKILGLYATHDL